MIITTTDSIEGKKIREYKGIVASEAVIWVNSFVNLFTIVRDFVSGRVKLYEKGLSKYRQQLIEELMRQASEKGANAIVGLNFLYEMYDSMLMISAWGTAVVVE